jgi:15-cis-phytoene synthase
MRIEDMLNDAFCRHYRSWRKPSDLGVVANEAWHGYLKAVAHYENPQADIPNLDIHRDMLLELGGNLFCLLPEVDWYLRRSIAHFGALHQYFEDLRELVEEGRMLRCRFPLDVMARFGVTPEDFSEQRWSYRADCAAFMSFWLDDYLPTLRHEAEEFINMKRLHPSLVSLRQACLRRHERIERILRESAFELEAIPAWQQSDGLSSVAA